jgi:PAS domain S-box-containing protein
MYFFHHTDKVLGLSATCRIRDRAWDDSAPRLPASIMGKRALHFLEFLCLWLVAVLPVFCSWPAAANHNQPQIVILNSYHYGSSWSDNELVGLLARLRQDYPEIEPPIEYLDAKRLPGPDQLERMRDYLASKYRGKRIDLVIALDNPALELATQYRQGVFPGVPLVFAGISSFTPAMLRGRKKVTGVAEVEDIAGTLELALTLHPHTRVVVVIHDYTASGLALLREMEAAALQFQDRVQFRFLPPSTFQEVAGQLQSLPANSLGLISAFVADRDGKVWSMAASTRLCAASRDFPLYATHDTLLGHGIVDGSLLSGADQGKRAGEMARKVLAGEGPDCLPMDTAGPHRLMFDYRQLTRFGIPLEALLAESIVINRPVSFYEEHKYLTLAVSWVFAFLLLTVGILAVAIVRQLRAEKRLRESEERYRNLMEASFDWIWEVDAENRFTYASPRVVDFLGYTPEEMFGHTPFEFMPEAEARRVEEIFGAIAAVRRPFTALENVNLHRDGRLVSLETSGAPMFEPGGEFKGYRGSNRDITARQAAEQALRESEERLRLANEAANIGTLDADLETGQVRFSPELCAILGVPSGTEWNVHEGIKIVHPEDSALVMAAVRRSQDPAGDGRIYSEHRIIRPDGEVRWLVWSGRTTFRNTPAGRVPCRGIGVAFDITERKRAERSLAEQFNFLQLLIDTIPSPIFYIDVNGVYQGCNQSLADFLGRPKEAIIGKTVFDTYPKEQAEKYFQMDQELFQPPGMQIYEFGMDRCNGAIRNFIFSKASFVDISGKIAGLIGVMTDITEWKQAEEALRASEQKFKTIFDSALDGILIADIETRKFYLANDMICQMLGYGKEELVQLGVRDIHPEADLPYVEEQFDKLARREITLTLDIPVKRKDGRVFYADIKSSFISLAGKTYLGGIFRDITQRKQAEEELRRSERRYRTLVDLTNQFAWVMDANGQAMEDCPAFRRFTGQTYQEMKGTGWTKVLHPDDLQRAHAVWSKSVSTRMPYEIEYRMRRHDGLYRVFLARGVPILNDDGSVLEWMCTCMDITERVLAQQKLRESNERFAAVFENAAIGISVADAQGRIIATNPCFQEMLGYHAPELLAKTFPEITHPEDLSRNLELFQEIMMGKSERFQLEKRYLRKNGEYFWARVTVSSIKEAKGQPPYSIAVVEDIALRKQTQEQLEESERNLRYLAAQLLTAQERERQRISRDLHDDLGQSLVVFKLQLEAIEREEPANLTVLRQKLAIQIAFIDDIVNNVRRLCMDLRPTTLDALGLIVALKRLFKEFSALYDIKFSLDLEDVRGLLSPQAQIIIYRIFQESLTNIAKYAQATRIAVTIKRENGTVFFTVEDNGKGFDLEQVRTRKDGKRGLGLVAMEERVRMLGGTLEMQSQKGVGTKISFKTPVS